MNYLLLLGKTLSVQKHNGERYDGLVASRKRLHFNFCIVRC